MSDGQPADQTEHTRRTLDAYERLASVWSATTDGSLQRLPRTARSAEPRASAAHRGERSRRGVRIGRAVRLAARRRGRGRRRRPELRNGGRNEAALRGAWALPRRRSGRTASTRGPLRRWHHLFLGAALPRGLVGAATILRYCAVARRLGGHLPRSSLRGLRFRARRAGTSTPNSSATHGTRVAWR